MSDNVGNVFLEELNAEIQAELNPKLNQAMRLFSECDNAMKSVVLTVIGFSGLLTAKSLRDHFDTIDLLDGLDDLIENMQEDIDALKEHIE